MRACRLNATKLLRRRDALEALSMLNPRRPPTSRRHSGGAGLHELDAARQKWSTRTSLSSTLSVLLSVPQRKRAWSTNARATKAEQDVADTIDAVAAAQRAAAMQRPSFRSQLSEPQVRRSSRPRSARPTCLP